MNADTNLWLPSGLVRDVSEGFCLEIKDRSSRFQDVVLVTLELEDVNGVTWAT